MSESACMRVKARGVQLLAEASQHAREGAEMVSCSQRRASQHAHAGGEIWSSLNRSTVMGDITRLIAGGGGGRSRAGPKVLGLELAIHLRWVEGR